MSYDYKAITTGCFKVELNWSRATRELEIQLLLPITYSGNALRFLFAAPFASCSKYP